MARALPQHWPRNVLYLSSDNQWHPQTTKETADRYHGLSQAGDPAKEALWAAVKQEMDVGDIPVQSYAPKRLQQLVRIAALPSTHPCYRSSGEGMGLFALKTLKPKAYLFDYLGCYVQDDLLDGHATEEVKDVEAVRMEESDYVLHLYSDLNIDAGKMGNEARFINDFRGVAPRPNVYFETYYDPTTDQLRAGVFSMQHPIAPGEELVTTYGVENYWALDAAMSQVRHDEKNQQEWQPEWDASR